uniref:Glutathione S-transferase kappa n=1 Tax=Panagrolaimus superbus TaxID=310955 RepID=A0A914YT82_9BILA
MSISKKNNLLLKIPTFIDLYFDVISPYAWIGFEGILRYEEKLKEKNVKLRLKPFFLGGILKASGNISPIMVPKKAEYMPKDLKMIAKYWGLNFNLNPKFSTEIITKQTLLPQRFLTALEQTSQDLLILAAREYWKRVWETHESIDCENDLKEVAKSIGLLDVEKYIELTKSTEIKNLLKHRTTEALEAGAFGAPWFVIQKKGESIRCLWGSDRIPILLNECGIEFCGPMKNKI